jgi:hypothetical protein
MYKILLFYELAFKNQSRVQELSCHDGWSFLKVGLFFSESESSIYIKRKLFLRQMPGANLRDEGNENRSFFFKGKICIYMIRLFQGGVMI